MMEFKIIFIYTLVFFYGVLIGNFTTTVFHRLPRNIMIAGFNGQSTKPPFCSHCGHLLKFYEFLPILSWFSTLGKCNYCNAPITKVYIILEAGLGIVAMILYFFFYDNLQLFFIYFCLSALVLVNIAIYITSHFISKSITLCIIMLGIIFRILVDMEIFPAITRVTLGFILSLWIIHKNSENKLPYLIMPLSLWLY